MICAPVENGAVFGQKNAPFSPHSAIIFAGMEIRLGQARRSFMRTFIKSIAAGLTGLLALGVTAAMAGHKPDYCDYDHDHRSHASNYYSYYPADRYSRAGPYSSSGFSFSIRVGDTDYDRYDRDRYDRYDRYDHHDRYDRDRYDRYDRRGRHDRGRHNGYRHRDGRIVKRRAFDTRYRATVILTEELYRGRRGPDLVCTVTAHGPDAHHVSKSSMKWLARNNCSRHAQIRIYS
jgi:hypothetical protein